jgi:regulation of enolase protein 1 (concanavalin A-like superfamily)
VRVDSVQNVHAWTKAGVMIRGGLTASDVHASLIVSPGKGVSFQRRSAQGGASVSTTIAGLTAPVWLRLTMQMSYPKEIVRAYYRKSPTDPWTLVGEDTFQAPIWQPVIGVAVSSHVAATAATATFSNISAGAIATADWSSANIGITGGTGSSDGTVVTMQGAGTDIWNTADQFFYLYRPLDGDATITARVRSLQNTHAWAKAGLMFRESIDASSKQVDAVVSPGKGTAMQYRAATGGATAQAGVVAGASPGWLRLTRSGNTFTSAWSKDGSTWTTIGSVNVTMPVSILVGLPVTSHNAAAATTAVFDDVTVKQP